MFENKPVFENKLPIADGCLTKYVPEEYDENGVGSTLTCIGFRPLRDEIVHAISRNYQLYE